MRKKATLCLADGSQYSGTMFGACQDVIGELVFNTGMTGYQEVVTDPSYKGQMVMLTYPLVGNYGVNGMANESMNSHPNALIIQELCDLPVDRKNEISLEEFLQRNDMTGLCDVDTRAVTRKIREAGVMNAAITSGPVSEDLLSRIRSYEISHPVDTTTCTSPYFIPGGDFCVAMLDMGAKQSIVRALMALGVSLKIYPARTPAYAILKAGCDGVVITNGPGDPKDNDYAYSTIRELMAKKPTMGICLGHQLMALSHGGDTYKMAFGHRGANHPVKDMTTGRIYITSQNHGYAVDGKKLPEGAELYFTSVNDGTVEGLRYENGFSVQFHPEAAPGPRDSRYLFQEFLSMIERRK